MVRDGSTFASTGTAGPSSNGHSTDPSIAKSSVVDRFVDAVCCGEPWGPTLIESIGCWSAPCETVDGTELTYLIAGEAFDWLLLAERLLRALDDRAPDVVSLEDKERLLFRGQLPPGVTPERFRESLGVDKFRAHLNYFYGVVVEEALWHAVEREVVKARGVRGLHHPLGLADLVSEKLYRADTETLLRRFHREQGRRPAAKFTLTRWKEFSYWLFKLRVGKHDSARTASDTRKGLAMLEEIWGVPPHMQGGLGFEPRAISA